MVEKRTRMTVRTGPVEEPMSGDTFTPMADIYETPDGTTCVLVEVPGASADKVEIKVDKGVLTVQADARLGELDQKYSRTYTGFTGGQFFRAFVLGDEIDREKIEASLSEGLLTLSLPKAAAARSRKIEIKT